VETKQATHGFLSAQEVQPRLPTAERLAKGPVAVIECVQEIPCNPCENACPFKAITVGLPITTLPALDAGKCVGCGACIAKCPGLAIFIVDGSRPGNEGTVQMPYETHPLPAVGDEVAACDRQGRRVATGTVEKVLTGAAQDHTAIITVRVPKEQINVVRAIRPLGRVD
jgi:Fe-S-cluster-containing hydrogenase component 2